SVLAAAGFTVRVTDPGANSRVGSDTVTVCDPAVRNVTRNVLLPLSAGENVYVSGRPVARGSVTESRTVPKYPGSSIPLPSLTVTVTGTAVPAVAAGGAATWY